MSKHWKHKGNATVARYLPVATCDNTPSRVVFGWTVYTHFPKDRDLQLHLEQDKATFLPATHPWSWVHLYRCLRWCCCSPDDCDCT